MTKKLAKSVPPPVNAVRNAFSIIRTVASGAEPMGVTAIARLANVSPSSCFNILRTLLDEGIVLFDVPTKTYTLDPATAELFERSTSDAQALNAALPHLRGLVGRFGGVVGFWKHTADGRSILLAKEECDDPVRIHMEVGQRLPVAAGAVGRVFLATGQVGPREIRQLFKLVRWHGEISIGQYIDDIDEACRLGYAIDQNTLFAGITTVAAAIQPASHAPKFCVSVSHFSGLFTDQDLKLIGEALLDSAGQLAKR